MAKFCKVVGLLADNARACQSAISTIQDANNEVCGIRCGAHTVNLIIKKTLETFSPIAAANEVLEKFIKNGEISRYCDTRWNSRIEKMIELQEKLQKDEPDDLDITCITHAVIILKPMLTTLDQAQSDNCDWYTVYTQLETQSRRARDIGYDQLRTIIDSYLPYTRNSVTVALLVLKGDFAKCSSQEVDMSSNWIRKISPSIAEDFDNYYLNAVMASNSVPTMALKVFTTQFLERIPTSEAAVERVFSRHKLVHSQIRASLKVDIVEKILFLRYSLQGAFPHLPFWGKEDECIDNITKIFDEEV